MGERRQIRPLPDCFPRCDGSQQTYIAFAHQAGGNTGLNIEQDLSGTLQANQAMAVAYDEDNFISASETGRGWYTESPVTRLRATGAGSPQNLIAATLNSGGNNGGFRTEPEEHLVVGALNDTCSVRRLTMTECERLQRFPDGHTKFGMDEDGKKVKISDSARYRQLGDAVAVPVARWIGKRIVSNQEDQTKCTT